MISHSNLEARNTSTSRVMCSTSIRRGFIGSPHKIHHYVRFPWSLLRSNDDWDMATARAKFAAKVAPGKAARKDRQKHLNGAVDGRSLRVTGRTAHLNFKALPEIKEAVAKAEAEAGITKSLWLEQAILIAIKAQESCRHA
jgi:hypothetical protein